MNSLVIPPSPNWYESSILACSPDNTLIYGARNDIVLIDNPDDVAVPANIRLIPKAHAQKIICLNINRNWGKPNKYFVSVGEDKIVKIWNAETLKKKVAHNAHLKHSRVVGATFAGDERVISVSEEGIIVVWNISVNETNVLKDVLGPKTSVTCISACPHLSWLTAFGLRNGLVVVADLRKHGKVIHRLRGHDKSVISLAWCPAPINIFPKHPQNHVVPTKKPADANISLSTVSTLDEDKTAKNSGTDTNQTPQIAIVINANEDPTDSVKEKETAVESDGSSVDKVASQPQLNIEVKALDNENLSNVNEECSEIREKEETAIKADESLLVVNNTLEEVQGTTESEFDDTKNGETISDLVCVEGETNAGKTVVPESSTEQKNPKKEYNNLWSNLKHADDDDFPKETESLSVSQLPCSGIDDFLKECDLLKQLIGKKLEESEIGEGKEIVEKRPVLKAKRLRDMPSTDTNESQIPDEPEDKNKLTSHIMESENSAVENGIIKEGDVPLDGSNVEGETETNRQIPKDVPDRSEEPRREFLLASSAKDGTIYIWRAGTDGRMQTFLTVPGKTNYHRNKFGPSKIWIPLFWITPTALLSSSRTHQLLKWTLPKPEDKSKQVTTIHNDHSSLLFSMAGPLIVDENNWLTQEKLNVWTVAQDQMLLNTNLGSERRNLACYPTFGGCILCLQLSPLDPTRLAIGTGDGFIKVWDLSRPHIRTIEMSNFYHKIQGKVMTLAWHPVNDLLLAYGTAEGRVGYLETSHKSKMPTLLPHFFKTQIHKVEWAPLNDNKDEFGLYAVGEGKLVCFSTGASQKAPIEVDKPENFLIYTFSWKPDYSLMLVCSKSGLVICYSPDLKMLSTHYFQKRVQDIVWHPESAGSDKSVSNYCFWFATVSMGNTVTVHEFYAEKNEKMVAKYEADCDLVNGICWSPFDHDLVVIAYDLGIAQVWNVAENKIISTYINFGFDPIISVIWSPVDPDFILTGGKDYILTIWKIQDYPSIDEKEIKFLRKKVVKEINSESKELLPKEESTLQDDVHVKNKISTKSILPKFYSSSDPSQIVADMKKILSWTEKPEEVRKTGEDQVKELDVLNIFGANTAMVDLVKLNESMFQEKGKYSIQMQLSLYRVDISTSIKDAIKEKRVNPSVIALAPMVSPKLWLEACETYADQLVQEPESDPLEIVTYYLASHKVDNAIDVLCEASLFREALAVAKCRLTDSDSTIPEIIEKWAKYSLCTGHYECSAHCHIYLGKYEEAASLLFRRNDTILLEFAAQLAEKIGKEDLHKAILDKHEAVNEAKIKHEEENSRKVAPLPSRAEILLQALNGSQNEERDSKIEEDVPEVCENLQLADRASGSDNEQNSETKETIGGQTEGSGDKVSDAKGSEPDDSQATESVDDSNRVQSSEIKSLQNTCII